MPIALYPGRTPTSTVETLIKPTTIASVWRRPSRSPSDPKKQSAEWSGNECDGECRESRYQANDRVAAWEEHLSQGGGKIAIQRVVNHSSMFPTAAPDGLRTSWTRSGVRVRPLEGWLCIDFVSTADKQFLNEPKRTCSFCAVNIR